MAEDAGGAWVVVRVASSLALAEMLEEILTNEGILVMLRSLGPPQMGAASPVEVLVPSAEAEDAVEVLDEVLSEA
ncbi:MAG TPA: DUF2007 domain-containing protein [Bacillota bacterium]|nr:DUF2007 domain-containing protein [Bacillota bacterium]